MYCFKNLSISAGLLLVFGFTAAQNKPSANSPKQISPDLFGIFFEDISYAADGGLYAELIQNRSFEYTPSDKDNWADETRWQPFTAWEFETRGYGYGTVSIETQWPIHKNNPHYVVIQVEEPGQEGVGIKNSGFDGIPVKAGEKYDFSVFARVLSEKEIPLTVQLRNRKGEVLGEASFPIQAAEWKKYTSVITATQSYDTASLVVLAKSAGKFALDVISLFPQKTFKNRPNGLRADLAETIAALKPKFMRFPGGCLVHGDGLGNMYRWKNTIGPVEQRVEQKNIWNYHQTAGLGYFEFFQFCEDIGAKPLPVLPAGVSCQNSGGTWRIGGTGQHCLPLSEMTDYIQEVLDLVEYANGPATSEWGAKRAAAGHPQPFHLEYIGIGNEDKQTPEFRERFKMIYDAVKAKHPEITVIGTVGPSPDGEDFELGWKFANELNIPMVDEHYYQKTDWFLKNTNRYDRYNRSKSKVYIGEYASWGNTLLNALVEAVYMTSLERNGDIVRMVSYAPMLARQNHTSWNPDLIYFSNTTVLPTVNYYVQKLFSANQGELYYPGVVRFSANDSCLAASCVKDSKAGDLILKIVNAGAKEVMSKINLPRPKSVKPTAVVTMLSGDPASKNSFDNPKLIIPSTAELKVARTFSYPVKPYSLSVIRIQINSTVTD